MLFTIKLPLELIFPLALILITSKAEPDIPTPNNWLPSPIKAPLVLISPLAVIEVNVWLIKSKLSITKFDAYTVPLELISPLEVNLALLTY